MISHMQEQEQERQVDHSQEAIAELFRRAHTTHRPMTTQQQPYTHIQFNDLPGWARDHILALEAQAAALQAARKALEWTLEQAEAWLGNYTGGPGEQEYRGQLQQARAALQQLTGGQQP